MRKSPSASRTSKAVRVSIPTKMFLGYALVTALFGAVLIYNFSRSSQLYSNLTVVSIDGLSFTPEGIAVYIPRRKNRQAAGGSWLPLADT